MCVLSHDGGHDGQTWDFTGRGEGLRNTIDLRGRAGMQHGNALDGQLRRDPGFENDIRNHFGGKGFMTDADFAETVIRSTAKEAVVLN